MTNIDDRVSKLEREVEKLKKPAFIVTDNTGARREDIEEFISKPVVKVGDRARVTEGGTWYEVTTVINYSVTGSAHYFRTSSNKSFYLTQIVEVYTKEEFEKNSTLLQYQDWTGVYDHLSEKFGFSHFTEYTRGAFSFLTSNAVKKLGEFKPAPDYDNLVQIAGDLGVSDRPYNFKHVPRDDTNLYITETPAPNYLSGFKPVDRRIKIGDCVRRPDGGVWNHQTDLYWLGEDVTHVAKEDKAYIPAWEAELLGRVDLPAAKDAGCPACARCQPDEPKTVDRAKVEEVMATLTERAKSYLKSNSDNPYRHEVNAAEIDGAAEGLRYAVNKLKNLLDESK